MRSRKFETLTEINIPNMIYPYCIFLENKIENIKRSFVVSLCILYSNTCTQYYCVQVLESRLSERQIPFHFILLQV